MLLTVFGNTKSPSGFPFKYNLLGSCGWYIPRVKSMWHQAAMSLTRTFCRLAQPLNASENIFVMFLGIITSIPYIGVLVAFLVGAPFIALFGARALGNLYADAE